MCQGAMMSSGDGERGAKVLLLESSQSRNSRRLRAVPTPCVRAASRCAVYLSSFQRKHAQSRAVSQEGVKGGSGAAQPLKPRQPASLTRRCSFTHHLPLAPPSRHVSRCASPRFECVITVVVLLRGLHVAGLAAGPTCRFWCIPMEPHSNGLPSAGDRTRGPPAQCIIPCRCVYVRAELPLSTHRSKLQGHGVAPNRPSVCAHSSESARTVVATPAPCHPSRGINITLNSASVRVSSGCVACPAPCAQATAWITATKRIGARFRKLPSCGQHASAAVNLTNVNMMQHGLPPLRAWCVPRCRRRESRLNLGLRCYRRAGCDSCS